jgi:regulator of sirC expression with transglutaminase-like and TPR domain
MNDAPDPGPLERFSMLVARPDAQIDLARACLQIAEDVYPGLDVEGYLGEIERFARRLGARLAPDASAEDRVIALNEFLFADLGFRGNAGNYYDPRNSYLNEVLDRRAGIPLTLAVLYLEFGRRIELPLEGVSFPGHFLVRLPMRGGTLVLDPFAGGVPQSGDELRERLKRVAAADLPLEQFLEPASKRQILARLLRNLKGIYREKGRPDRLLQVLNRMIILAPEAAGERRDRGYVYQQLECWRPALQDMTEYLEREPDAADVHEVRASVMELSRRCARLN